MTQQKILLYQFEDCPFCEKVRKKLREKNLEFEKVEVPRDRNSEIIKDLFKKSGVLTVPVIKIGGKFIGESKDIIDYLDENF
jgi:alkyl hydroperoxide reductase subunit F